MGAVFHYDLHVWRHPLMDKATTVSIPSKITTSSTRPNWTLTNGYKPPKLPDANLPYWLLPTKQVSTLAKDVNPYCLKSREMERRERRYCPWLRQPFAANMVCNRASISVSDGTLPSITGPKWEGAFAPNRQAWYKRLWENGDRTLHPGYGDLYMIWFDGGADDPRGDGPDVEPDCHRKYQPNCLFYHNIDRADFRWGRFGDRYSGISLLVYLSRPLLTP